MWDRRRLRVGVQWRMPCWALASELCHLVHCWVSGPMRQSHWGQRKMLWRAQLHQDLGPSPSWVNTAGKIWGFCPLGCPILRYQASKPGSLHLESWLCTYLLWAENYVQKIRAVVEIESVQHFTFQSQEIKVHFYCYHYFQRFSNSHPRNVSLDQKSWPQFRIYLTSSKKDFGWLKMWKIISNRTIKDGKRTETIWGSREVGLPGTL